MSAGSIESSIDGDLPTERTVEVEGATIWFRIHGLLQRMQELLTKRHDEARGPDPDYVSGISDLRDLENLIRQIARDHEPGVHIVNHPKPPRNEWSNKLIMGVAVTVIATAIIGAVVTYATVSSLETRIADYIISNNQRMDSVELRLRDTERRLDRTPSAPP